MPSCVAFGCSNSTSRKRFPKGVTFHCFPKDEARRKAWISAVRRKNWAPSSGSTLCSTHFEEKHIDRSSMCTVRLRQEAIPTIFPGFPLEYQKQLREEEERRKKEEEEEENKKCAPKQDTVAVTKVPEVEMVSTVNGTGEYIIICYGVPTEEDSCKTDETIPRPTPSVLVETEQSTSSVPILPDRRDNEVMLAEKEIREKVPNSPCRTQTESELCQDQQQLANHICSPQLKRKADDEETLETKKLQRDLLRCTELLTLSRKKIKLLEQATKRLRKRVTSLKAVKYRMMKNGSIDKEHHRKEHCEMLSTTSSTSGCIVKRQKVTSLKNIICYLKKNGLVAGEYCEVLNADDLDLKSFAISLHYFSPNAYSHVRQTFANSVPHPHTISRWYQTLNACPGFSSEVLQVLQDQCSSTPGICALMLNSIQIREDLKWDGHHLHGLINIGVFYDDDSAPLAKEALVFHLVSINSSWQQVPVGYFLVDSASGQQLCGLVQQCLILLNEINVQVVSLTCEGTWANISMANQLGCNISVENLKTDFPHPITAQPVYFFVDPCHMLKLVRNTIIEMKYLVDEQDMLISWNYFDKLNELQSMEGLHFGNELTDAHVKRQKLKVKLSVQTLSNSMADALQYCMNKRLHGFHAAKATVRFIKIFNRLFDILSSRSIHGKFNKKALCCENIAATKLFFAEARSYIMQLKDTRENVILTTNRRTGFLGFLVCMQSTSLLCDALILDPLNTMHNLEYLPMHKLSQNHLERLFSLVRPRVGHHDPTSKQFTESFRRVLVNIDLRETTSENCLPLDKINILPVPSTSKTPEAAINESLSRYRLMEDLDSALDNVDNDCIIMMPGVNDIGDMALDIMEYIVEYIARFIARTLTNRICCEECSRELSFPNSDTNYLIQFKKRDGFLKPSHDLVKICKFCEKAVRALSRDTIFPNQTKFVYRCVTMVFEMCRDIDLFSNLNGHFVEYLMPHENHYLLLITAIVKLYVKVRLNDYAVHANSSFDLKAKQTY